MMNEPRSSSTLRIERETFEARDSCYLGVEADEGI